MPRAAASTWAPRSTPASSRADAATAGSDRLASSRTLAEQVVRVQRLDLDDQLAAQDQAEDRVVAEAGLVDPVEAHGGDDLTRGRDVAIDGVEQRPPARGPGWPGRRRCHSAGR